MATEMKSFRLPLSTSLDLADLAAFYDCSQADIISSLVHVAKSFNFDYQESLRKNPNIDSVDVKMSYYLFDLIMRP